MQRGKRQPEGCGAAAAKRRPRLHEPVKRLERAQRDVSRAAAGNRDEPSGRERKSEALDAVLPSKRGDRARLRPGQLGSLRPWVGRALIF